MRPSVCADKRARARMSLFDKLPRNIRKHLAAAPRDLDARFLMDAIQDYAATETELLKLIEVKLERII